MLTAIEAWLALHDGGLLVTNSADQLVRVIEVREGDLECLVETEGGRRINRDWHDMTASTLLKAMVEEFTQGKPRPPYNGGTLVAAIPLNAANLHAGYAIVVRVHDKIVDGEVRGEFVGFGADTLGESTWGQGHYFHGDSAAAMDWALRRAGLLPEKTV